MSPAADDPPTPGPLPEPDDAPGAGDVPEPDVVPSEEGGDRVRASMARSTALMASGAMVSRVLGFIRTFLYGMVTAGSATVAGSAFSAANVLPDSLWILVGGGVMNAILVPAIVRATSNPDRGSDFVSRLMTLVVMITAAFTVLCMIAVPLLITMSNGTLPPATYVLAIQMALFLLPQIIFSALYVMYGQLLNAHESFGPYQWAPVLNNVVGIVVAILFLLMWGSAPNASDWHVPQLITLALMNVGGSAAQVAWLWYSVRKLNLHLRPKWGFRGLGLRKLSGIGLWTMAMIALGQLAVYAARWSTGRATKAIEHFQDTGRPDLASHYSGLLSLSWGYMVFMIPQGIIAVTLVTAAFPALSRHAAAAAHSDAMLRYATTQRMLLAPMMLSTAVFMALCVPIMWVVGGGTSAGAAMSNGLVLAAYMVGLVPMSAVYLIKRVFYAYEDARASFLMQIPTTLVPVLAVVPILLLVDPRWAGMAAALSISLGNVAGWLHGLWLLDRHATRVGVPFTTAKQTASTFLRLLVATGAAFAVGLAIWWELRDLFFLHRVVAIAMGAADGLLMCAVFAGLSVVLRIEEVTSGMAGLRRRLLRR